MLFPHRFGEKKVHAPKMTMMARPVQTLATFIFKYRSIGRPVAVFTPDFLFTRVSPCLDILRADGIAPPEPAVKKTSGTKRKATDDEVEVCEEVDDKEELKVLQVSTTTVFLSRCHHGYARQN
jgi:hypothetical protein